MNTCEHCTGTVLFDCGKFSIVRCDWGCGTIRFRWRHDDLVTRTFWTWKGGTA